MLRLSGTAFQSVHLGSDEASSAEVFCLVLNLVLVLVLVLVLTCPVPAVSNALDVLLHVLLPAVGYALLFFCTCTSLLLGMLFSPAVGPLFLPITLFWISIHRAVLVFGFIQSGRVFLDCWLYCLDELLARPRADLTCSPPHDLSRAARGLVVSQHHSPLLRALRV